MRDCNPAPSGPRDRWRVLKKWGDGTPPTRATTAGNAGEGGVGEEE